MHTNIGIIGCGNISGAYFHGAKHATNLTLKACADLYPAVALARAEEHGVQAMTVDELLADPEISLVVNLTIPAAHVDVGLRILEAGKHVYAEKPLATDLQSGRVLIDTAQERGLRVGSAPDTFLFKGAQTSRKLIDDGWIGEPLSGTAFMKCHGHENWHPNPGFYYEVGGGPLMDMGPYYLTALVNFLGPIKSVMARCTRGFRERLATSELANGRMLPVSVDTHCAGILEFHSGPVITMIMSFDTWKASLPALILHGTQGSLNIGDPNSFSANPLLFRAEDNEERAIAFTHANNQRMIGVVDMVDAIAGNRPHRASGELALHVLEAMVAFDTSSKGGAAVELKTRPDRPDALPLGLPAWRV
ncbi:MAG: Gfo/Idh/MocA family protein [Verrucomicrobiales bacterium]